MIVAPPTSTPGPWVGLVTWVAFGAVLAISVDAQAADLVVAEKEYLGTDIWRYLGTPCCFSRLTSEISGDTMLFFALDIGRLDGKVSAWLD